MLKRNLFNLKCVFDTMCWFQTIKHISDIPLHVLRAQAVEPVIFEYSTRPIPAPWTAADRVRETGLEGGCSGSTC